MSIRVQISAMVFMMAQAVLFGIGMLAILSIPTLNANAMVAIPAMVAASMVLAAVISWLIAPRLRMSYWRRRGVDSDVISG